VGARGGHSRKDTDSGALKKGTMVYIFCVIHISEH
jgi:hypothetical protein